MNAKMTIARMTAISHARRTLKLAITTPVSQPAKRSAGAQITAEAILAIANRIGRVGMVPATKGTIARNGPKNLPMKTLKSPYF